MYIDRLVLLVIWKYTDACFLFSLRNSRSGAIPKVVLPKWAINFHLLLNGQFIFARTIRTQWPITWGNDHCQAIGSYFSSWCPETTNITEEKAGCTSSSKLSFIAATLTKSLSKLVLRALHSKTLLSKSWENFWGMFQDFQVEKTPFFKLFKLKQQNNIWCKKLFVCLSDDPSFFGNTPRSFVHSSLPGCVNEKGKLI